MLLNVTWLRHSTKPRPHTWNKSHTEGEERAACILPGPVACWLHRVRSIFWQADIPSLGSNPLDVSGLRPGARLPQQAVRAARLDIGLPFINPLCAPHVRLSITQSKPCATQLCVVPRSSVCPKRRNPGIEMGSMTGASEVLHGAEVRLPAVISAWVRRPIAPNANHDEFWRERNCRDGVAD